MKSVDLDHELTLPLASDNKFDVVVIGSGMGGSCCAYSLTKAGFNVLLLEKGNTFLNEEPINSIEVENNNSNNRLNNARWPTQINTTINDLDNSFYPPLGCGTGGSTLLYGGALERLSPEDFNERNTSSGHKIVWPYSYTELEPYYQRAETIFNVHGTADKLEINTTYHLFEPAPLNGTDQYFFDLFKRSGLAPYHLHVALSASIDTPPTVAGALECCLKPALTTGKLKIIPNCQALKLEATDSTVNRVIVEQRGEAFPITTPLVILAAGAYFTPALLLNSSNKFWPNGLCNRNDVVGRNLMFHVSDYIGIWSTAKRSSLGAQKTLAFRDLYRDGEDKLGELQSTGKSAEFGYILFFLRLKLDTSLLGKIPFLSKIIRQLLRIPAYLASLLFRDASIFASIIEDYPHPNNRVQLDKNKPSGIRFHYNIDDDLKRRVKRFKYLVKKRINTPWIINFSDGINLNYGHPCGTCRAGTDPLTSVIDKSGKAHDFDNLYIADSSFMPSSGGTNPSLTVAANALKTADAIIGKLQHLKNP